MKHAPCMNCQDRVLGCHSQCERYKGFRAELDEINRKRREDDLRASASHRRVRLDAELSRRRTQQYNHHK